MLCRKFPIKIKFFTVEGEGGFINGGDAVKIKQILILITTITQLMSLRQILYKRSTALSSSTNVKLSPILQGR